MNDITEILFKVVLQHHNFNLRSDEKAKN